MANAQPKEPQSALLDAATNCMRSCNGNIAEAADALETHVRKSRPLRDELTDPLLKAACYDVMRKIMHSDRERIVRGAFKQPDTSGRIVALATSLLEFPLPGGKRLRDATRADLRTAANFYQKQSDTMAKRARWFTRIAAKLPNQKTVADVFDDAKLSAMLEIA